MLGDVGTLYVFAKGGGRADQSAEERLKAAAPRWHGLGATPAEGLDATSPRSLIPPRRHNAHG
jgi:hypothetical protein